MSIVDRYDEDHTMTSVPMLGVSIVAAALI